MQLTRRQFVIAASAAATAAAWPANAAQLLQGPAFGTRWHAVVPLAEPAQAVVAAISAVVESVDRQFSPYRGDSAVSHFNRSDSTDWIEVPDDVARLARVAARLNAASGGAFDPTVGPLVARYGFGPIEGARAPLAALDIRPGALRKADPGLTLDFCGNAKGHALDRIIDALVARGTGTALVELGGEVRTLGRHPSGRGWRVAVERPIPGADRAQHIVVPRGRALATSGHAAQGFSSARGNVSHLIDPRTGRPADQRLASVTVLADSAVHADAMATALAVLGPHDGPAAAADLNVWALFLLHDGSELREIATGGFDAHIEV